VDFIEGLPKTLGVDYILVVVDKFTHYGHFIALSHPYTAHSVALFHPYTAHSVALAFLNSVYMLHGLPASIVSHRDPIFTSHFWQSLFKLARVSLHLSSAYHPQSDGQTEQVNQCLEIFLCCFVQSSWGNGRIG
jgi:hypothetical protein